MVWKVRIQPNDPVLLVECVTIWELADQVVNGLLAGIVELTGLSSCRQSTNCCLLTFADCGDCVRRHENNYNSGNPSSPREELSSARSQPTRGTP